MNYNPGCSSLYKFYQLRKAEKRIEFANQGGESPKNIYVIFVLKICARKFVKTGIVSPTDPTFFPGRCGQVIVNGKPVGIVGVLHPDVISRFDLNLPCAALEIDIEALI